MFKVDEKTSPISAYISRIFCVKPLFFLVLQIIYGLDFTMLLYGIIKIDKMQI